MQNYQIFKFTSYVTDQKLSDILLDPALFGVVLHELETGEQYQCMLFNGTTHNENYPILRPIQEKQKNAIWKHSTTPLN